MNEIPFSSEWLEEQEAINAVRSFVNDGSKADFEQNFHPDQEAVNEFWADNFFSVD
jgi:hypothetical protein